MGKPVPVLARPERRQAPVRVEVDDSAMVADKYEDALIGLLFRVEHLRDGIAANLANNRLGPAQILAGELMDQVARFADEHCDLATESEMAEPVARAADFRATIVPARAAPQPTYHQIHLGLKALHEAVFAAFVVFTNRFSDSHFARGWVEVAATFTVELKRLVQEMPANSRS